MKTVATSGTLGDAYIMMLKIRNIRDRVIANHHTIHKQLYGSISEIFSLTKNVEVRFAKEPRTDLGEITSDTHTQDMDYFPDLRGELVLRPTTMDFMVTPPYTVIQPHSGKPSGFNAKHLPKQMINEAISNDPIGKFVILGTDEQYADITGCVNLIGQTSLLDAMRITAHADGFVGPEGLLGFVSISHRILSSIFYTSSEAVERRIIGTPWKEYATLWGI